MNTQLQQIDPLLGVPVLPGRWPFVGHLFTLGRDMPGAMRRIQAMPSKLAWVDVGGGKLGLIWADSRVFDLLKNQVTTSEHLRESGGTIVGESVVATDGAPHHRMRGAMNKAFTPKGLTASGVCRIICEVVSARVPMLFERSGFTALDETQRLALDIIFRVMGVPDDELEGFRQNYNRLLVGGVGPQIQLPLSPAWWSKRARAWLDARFEVLIQRARVDDTMEGLLADLVRGKDERGEGQSDRELMDNLVLLALAGHETTASVMAWMLAYAEADPARMAALFDEVGADTPLPESPKDLARFPWVTALFRESLRLHPPASMITRQVSGELALEELAVPEGTTLLVPLWLLGRDPEAYPEPDRFDLERWTGRERGPTPFEKAAFGGGPHFCLGYHVAVVEGVTFMVGALREMQRQGKRLRFPRGLPREGYFPLLRPKRADTRVQVVAAAGS